MENFVSSIGLLSGLVALVAILVGVTAGTGDLRAGVFRELVVTGRPRVSLFAARIPGWSCTATACRAGGVPRRRVAAVALAGGEPTPGLRLLVLTGAWIAILATSPSCSRSACRRSWARSGRRSGCCSAGKRSSLRCCLGIDSLGMSATCYPGRESWRSPPMPRAPAGDLDGVRRGCRQCRALVGRAARGRRVAHEYAGRLTVRWC